MNNDQIETRDEELARVESSSDDAERLTVEVPTEIRAGLFHNSTEVGACGCELA